MVPKSQSIDRTFRWGTICIPGCAVELSPQGITPTISVPHPLLISPNVCSVPMNCFHFSSDTIGATTYGATSIRARYSSRCGKTASSARASRSRSSARVMPRPSTYHASSCSTDTISNRSRSGPSTCDARAASYAIRCPIAWMNDNERGRTF